MTGERVRVEANGHAVVEGKVRIPLGILRDEDEVKDAYVDA